MLEEFKKRVCAENKRLVSSGLVLSTWGNVSARCEDTGYVVIKPSGVSYEVMLAEDMVVLSLEGEVVEGALKPSSDTMTHLELYRHCPEMKSIVHTHSTYATIWAQMGKPILPLGTTHADDFYGEIPCTREITEEEIAVNYEQNTGFLILDTLQHQQGIKPESSSSKTKEVIDVTKTPAVLVKHHGAFVWGTSPEKAVMKAVILEEVAKIAWHCHSVGVEEPISRAMMDKHFFRKHGGSAYYGQKN